MIYIEEHDDANSTKKEIEAGGQEVLAFAGDVADEQFCTEVVEQTMAKFNRLDVVINNAGEQHPQKRLEDITEEQWQRTFSHQYFWYVSIDQGFSAPYENRLDHY